ncbi:MAG: glycosyltransferase [Bacteroidales bacterium]|nr:glycosyltransferase [Bacteroidales bacterium]
MDNPKISVVTVVYNSKALIENTVKSIINQSYNHIEYIVVDGGSTDGTIDILNSYKKNISTLISEPDHGIYDAMNKGISLATGDFVVFINSGDKFSSDDILEKIFSNPEAASADVVYGDTDITDSEGNIIHSRRHRPPERLNWKSFKRGMLVCHQSFIARRNLVESYNLNYRYAADFDWCIRILKKSKSVYNSRQVISLFLEGGQTRKTIVPGLKERFKIMRHHYGLISAIYRNIILGVRFTWFVIRHRWF